MCIRDRVCTVCSVLLCVGLLSGCGTSLEGEESVVYVGKKGVIESLDVESLDQSYYDETELKSYVDAEVKDYTAEHGKNAVEVESLKDVYKRQVYGRTLVFLPYPAGGPHAGRSGCRSGCFHTAE